MNELIKVNFDDEQSPTVSGRDLYEALGIGAQYTNWIERMCEYGFIEGRDFLTILLKTPDGGRPSYDHAMTIAMAKEICMIQRTDIGKKYRAYFLELERRWNNPEAVMERALAFAKRRLAEVMDMNDQLTETNAVQAQQIAELSPKASYYDVCLACKDLLPISQISKDYGWSAIEMNRWLADQGVQFRQGSIWLLYQKYAEQGYTQTKTHVHPGNDGEPHTTVHTYWTQKGRLFIYDLMKQAGHLPTMEKEYSTPETTTPVRRINS